MGYIIPRKRILKLWIEAHQQLTDEQIEDFLKKGELDFLCHCDENIVREAILQSPKLTEIVRIVKDAVRPTESFSDSTIDQSMYEAGKGYNDRRPKHPTATCKSCGAKIVLKENSNTAYYFWGCPNWRFDSNSCRITMPIPYDEARKIIESRRRY